MRLKKYIIILTATICVVSLVFVAVYQRCGKAFVADILIGIFSSSFLAFLVSILEYANERRETMEKFYSAALEAIHVINQYRVDYDLDVAINLNNEPMRCKYGNRCVLNSLYMTDIMKIKEEKFDDGTEKVYLSITDLGCELLDWFNGKR